MPRRQLADAARDREGLGHKAQGEERAQGRGIDRPHLAQHRFAGLQIRAKGKAAAIHRVEQRLLAKAVARGEQGPRPRVPDRKHEHADDARQQSRAPLLPPGEDHFGVGLGAEAVPELRQLGLDLRIVEDLAVEDDDKAVALHRLRRRGGKIDHRQARMHQSAGFVREDIFAVRPAPAQMIARGMRALLGIAKAAQVNQSGNATHAIVARLLR